MRVKLTIQPTGGGRFSPDQFAPLIGKELRRRPGAVRAWLVAATVAPDGLSAELTADLVEPTVGQGEDQHGQGV
jgi:hypothetical protein